MMDKSKKKKQQVLTDEVACKIISKAFSDIIKGSEDSEFIKKCVDILQVKVNNKCHLENKLNETFTDMIKSKSTYEMNVVSSSEQNDSTDLFLENLTNSSTRVLEELDGFGTWNNEETKDINFSFN